MLVHRFDWQRRVFSSLAWSCALPNLLLSMSSTTCQDTQSPSSSVPVARAWWLQCIDKRILTNLVQWPRFQVLAHLGKGKWHHSTVFRYPVTYRSFLSMSRTKSRESMINSPLFGSGGLRKKVRQATVLKRANTGPERCPRLSWLSVSILIISRFVETYLWHYS